MITLLATDIDGTLVGDDSSLNDFNKHITTLQNSGKVRLVYVTGRSLEMFNDIQAEKNLIVPDALIAAVGGEIYLKGIRQNDWPIVDRWHPEQIAQVVAVYSGIKPQPPTEQRDFKRCYYFDDATEHIAKIQNELGDDYSVIYSSNRYLDILPTGVNKASAIRQLCSYWRMPLSNVIAAGDSGNDIAMLEQYKAIMVGNSSHELQTWRHGCKNNNLYAARKTYAAGILEGLRYFGVIED